LSRPVTGVLIALVAACIAALWYFLHFSLVDEPEPRGTLAHGELEWEGHSRTYTYYRPERTASNPALVYVFHGSGGNAAQARLAYAYEFERLADRFGFIAVYPDGYEKHFNGCRDKGPYAANELDIDDVGYLRQLTEHFIAQYAVHPGAVFATGLSNGGQMALRLALESPDLVAAVAPVATSMPTPQNMGCTPSGEPVAFLLINGTDDPMNPYHGGKVALYGLVGDRGEVLSSRESVRYWARLAGYTGAPGRYTLPDQVAEDESTVEVTLWTEPAREPVALYTVYGGGHNAPHPQLKAPRLLGGTNRDFIAAEAIWAFFQTARDTQHAP
jgi:polyhydroxybutyrate depolymerase